MFTNIDIRKFRSCSDVRLSDLNKILVLIGRNGAGKTNVLKAVQWVAQFVSGVYDRNSPNLRRLHGHDGDVALSFIIRGRVYCYELAKNTSYEFKASEGIEANIEITERISVCDGETKTLLILRQGERVELTPIPSEEVRGFEIAKTASVLVAIQALFPEKSEYRSIANDIRQFMSTVKYYPLHNFEETEDEAAITGQVYKKWKATRVKELTSVNSLILTIIHMKEEREDSFDELNSLIGPNGLGLMEEIQVISHKFPNAPSDLFTDAGDNTYYFVRFKIHDSEDPHGYGVGDLSFGTVRILYLLVSLLYDRATVSLVEQPEDGIHIALVDKLVPLLRSYSEHSQFIIASHSTAVLNRSKPEEIRLVSIHDGKTQVRALSENELDAAAGYLEEDGPLSDFLISLGDD